MNKCFAIFCLTFIGFCLPETSTAGKIEKAYEALSIYDYFKAKQIFEKRLKKDSAAAAYGLSIIYGRRDNPFFQLDSAYSYICIADHFYPKLEEKKKEKLSSFDLDSMKIQNWKDTIDLKIFRVTHQKKTVESYQSYMDRHIDSDWREKATNSRDSILFHRVKEGNHSRDYLDFIENYPNSIFLTQAKNKYEERKFMEVVELNKGRHYRNFVLNNPKSPYLSRAQDSVYAKYTTGKTIEEYDNFIQQNPKNPNVSRAWRNIYRLFTSEYSPSRIVEFQIDYPGYPFKNELKIDLKLSNKRFLPFAKGGKWGFMDELGKVMISPKYDFVEPFSEGLALCLKDGKLGFIDKSEEIIIPFEYDEAEPFNSGVSIVEKDGFYGVIDRTNQAVLSFKYDYVGKLSSNLFLIEEEGLYGFANKEGQLVVPPTYDYASDFKNGFALVEKDGKKGIIDSKAEVVIPITYTWLELPNTSGAIRAKNDSLFGLINSSGEEILPFQYDQIGQMNSGMLLVRSGDKYGYVNKAGEVIVPLKYNYSQGALLWGEFEGGYAKYLRKEKFGMIDSLGEEIVPAIFENIRSYNDSSLFPVKKRGMWGYSNPKLQLIIPYSYLLAERFENDLAIVKSDTAYGIINKEGEWSLKPKYRSIEKAGESFIVSSDDKFGLIADDMTSLLLVEYTKLERVDEEYFKLSKGKEVCYYSIKKKMIITPQSNS